MPTSLLRTRNKFRQGFTLTEMIIAIGIVGFVMAGIWAAAAEMNTRRTVTDTVKGIQFIVQNVRTNFNGRSAFSGGAGWNTGNDITTNIIQMRAIPTYFLDPAVPLAPRSAWSRRIFVRVSAGSLQNFDVHFNGPINAQICRSLVAAMMGPTRDPGLLEIRTGTNTFNGAALDVPPPAGMGACASASFTFVLRG